MSMSSSSSAYSQYIIIYIGLLEHKLLEHNRSEEHLSVQHHNKLHKHLLKTVQQVPQNKKLITTPKNKLILQLENIAIMSAYCDIILKNIQL